MSSKARARAVVDVTLRVEISQPWGEDCTVGQALRQGREDALNQVRNLVDGLPKMRILNTTTTQVIITEETR